jgi:prophage regulatory protein
MQVLSYGFSGQHIRRLTLVFLYQKGNKVKTEKINQFKHDIPSASSADKKIIRPTDVIKKIGLSRSSLYKHMAAGTFPQSITLGDRAIGFLSSDIDAWIDSRIASSKVAEGGK